MDIIRTHTIRIDIYIVSLIMKSQTPLYQSTIIRLCILNIIEYKAILLMEQAV